MSGGVNRQEAVLTPGHVNNLLSPDGVTLSPYDNTYWELEVELRDADDIDQLAGILEERAEKLRGEAQAHRDAEGDDG